ncbi:putative dynein assembly factor 1, axonemal-like [Trypanosoma theileri]|uniref:Putative dynein assembly factor 1, axonemal-like n=1 Tax=Trypanosoma theileri TaxID=67003 RepID=A0A1X0P4D9_9TRYP|nr:putative dynein assembly factor 1, axonemal-like [Trypanosoma theileri]ORC91310.1 putative dynein assembly factor 1, axonemal-like [Trypanosoma theileri]
MAIRNSESENVLMTEEAVIRQCKIHKGYSTPELNEKLYLHHLGFTKISSLDAFHQCTVLYLNNNAINNFEGIGSLQRLYALYISNNAFQDCLSLPLLPSLRILDISCNSIASLKGLANAPGLETLLVSRNCIENLEGLEPLENLVNLDVSLNLISKPENILPFIFAKNTLRTCILHGNDFIGLVPSYRKTLISRLPSLRFLDRYPVFQDERKCAEAYATGGVPAEKAQREENQREEEEERKKQFIFFTEHRAAAQLDRAAEGPTTARTTYFKDNETDDMIYIPNR